MTTLAAESAAIDALSRGLIPPDPARGVGSTRKRGRRD